MYLSPKAIYMKKYRVTLTDKERSLLVSLIESRKGSLTLFRRAQILLGADEGLGGKKMTDVQICKAYDVSVRTIERTRERFVEEGFEIALNGKPRPLNVPIKMDGELEAHLIATACSEAPEGYQKWTSKLLVRELKRKGYVLELSEETVRRTLKKTKLSPGKSSTM